MPSKKEQSLIKKHNSTQQGIHTKDIMSDELKQTQSLAPEDYYKDDEIETVQNNNMAVLEKDDNNQDTTPPPPPTQAITMTPAAPKKSRIANGTKGKQPLKKQKLNFEEVDTEETANDRGSSTSLGKHTL